MKHSPSDYNVRVERLCSVGDAVGAESCDGRLALADEWMVSADEQYVDLHEHSGFAVRLGHVVRHKAEAIEAGHVPEMGRMRVGRGRSDDLGRGELCEAVAVVGVQWDALDEGGCALVVAAAERRLEQHKRRRTHEILAAFDHLELGSLHIELDEVEAAGGVGAIPEEGVQRGAGALRRSDIGKVAGRFFEDRVARVAPLEPIDRRLRRPEQRLMDVLERGELRIGDGLDELVRGMWIRLCAHAQT
jgi:hypothetical protein